MALGDLDLNYSFSFLDEDPEEARRRKSRHVYESFVRPALENDSGRKIFQPNEVQEDIRPPYSYREVKDALEYASREAEGIEFIEEDMELFLYVE